MSADDDAPARPGWEEELGGLLAKDIPLSLAMGARVERASSSLVRIGFPLESNRNRQGTAFGGGLYAAAVLAGWSLLWCLLKEKRLGADVVIASSGERFFRPVDGPFVAECAAAVGTFAGALRTLRRRGMARADLECEILCKGRSCMVFRGTYGLIKKKGKYSW